MHGLFHSLNIGTLATWISVAGFGGVAVFAPEKTSRPIPAKPPETQLIEEDFTLGESSPVESPAIAPSTPAQPGPAEILPTPPELPELAETAPLPEIPDLPVPKAAAPAPTRVAPPAAAPRRNPELRPQSATAGTGTRNSPASGPRASNSGGTGALSESSRLAAGRMPPPTYPAEAKRRNQTGTVVVEFTVDSNGRVISAYAKSSSGWTLLDSEALRTVRRWKFPAGSVMKLQRPIVFQLR